jgi:hypothetical protein
MSDALSFAEIDGQHVELLPARTVLSLFTITGGGKVNNCSTEMKNNLNVGVAVLNDVLGIISPGDDGTSVGQSATTNCSNK